MKKTANSPKRSEFIYKLFIYVVLGLLAISIMVPLAWVLMASVKDNSEFYGNPWALPSRIVWQNFADAWTTARMGEYMLNSVIVTVLALALLLLFALPAAYALTRFEYKSKKTINIFLTAGLFINVNYIVVPIFLMLIDMDKAFVRWFGRPIMLNNVVVLAFIYAATALPFTIHLLKSYFSTLPKSYEEAAYIDGASHFTTMVRVMIPMARPSIITVILFNFLSFWNEYIISRTLLTDPNGAKTLPVGLMNLMKAQNAAAQYGQMYAGLAMVMLPTLILYIFVQKNLTQGMTVGGLKQ